MRFSFKRSVLFPLRAYVRRFRLGRRTTLLLFVFGLPTLMGLFGAGIGLVWVNRTVSAPTERLERTFDPYLEQQEDADGDTVYVQTAIPDMPQKALEASPYAITLRNLGPELAAEQFSEAEGGRSKITLAPADLTALMSATTSAVVRYDTWSPSDGDWQERMRQSTTPGQRGVLSRADDLSAFPQAIPAQPVGARYLLSQASANPATARVLAYDQAAGLAYVNFVGFRQLYSSRFSVLDGQILTRHYGLVMRRIGETWKAERIAAEDGAAVQPSSLPRPDALPDLQRSTPEPVNPELREPVDLGD